MRPRFGCGRWLVLPILLVAVLSATAHPAGAAILKRELTPADAIATVRVMQNQVAPGHVIDSDMASPDGRRYVIRVAHGDVERNGVWVDLFTGRLNSLAAASHPVLCAHLLTTGLGTMRNGTAADFDPQPSNLLRWLNSQEVAFLWSDEHQVRQVLSVDLTTCKHNYLTHSPTNVYSFAMAGNGTLLFDAQVPRVASAAPRLWSRGFTVSDSSDGWAILKGDIDGVNTFDLAYDNRWFMQSPLGSIHPVNIAGKRIDPSNPSFREIAVAPNSQVAVMHVGLQTTPEDWSHYSNSTLQTSIATNRTNPNRIPLQYLVLDLRDGTSRSLWNAPKTSRTQLAWSPRSDAVVLAPTFLPLPTSDAAGSAGVAAAEVEVATGNYKPLPTDLTARTVASIAWLSATTVEIHSTDLTGKDARAERFERNADHWQRTANDSPDPSPQQPARLPIQLEIRQTLNRPPRVFAVDHASGDYQLVLDLDPQLLGSFKLGHVERISGQLPTGQQWLGQLIYPADYVAGQKYPLLIQSCYGQAWGQEEFSLDGSWGASGMGLGPTTYASYPGQLLATRGIAVLELEVLHPSPGVKQAEDYQLAFETVAEQLSSSGFIDRNKIALVGFSRNGYWVEFTLAHSTFPFAAAIAADNYDPSYFQSALANWRTEDAEMNGAAAFGAGLQQWLERAPGFNAEHIHTPLLMIGQSLGMPFIMAKWEMYSRLRHLHKPVELYMMPDADKYPSHTPQNPRQIIAIQDSVIDWLSFWLSGREDPKPQKRAQYARWHTFRDLQAVPNPQL